MRRNSYLVPQMKIKKSILFLFLILASTSLFGKDIQGSRLVVCSSEKEVSSTPFEEKIQNVGLKTLFFYENKVQEIVYSFRYFSKKDIKNFSDSYSFSFESTREKPINQEFNLQNTFLPFYLLHQRFLI